MDTPAYSPDVHRALAKHLDDAMREGREVERLTVAYPNLNLGDAYLIEDEGVRLREARGERVIGLKMGLTSRAKREQMSLNAAIYGVLTDEMRVAGTFSLKGAIHPKIEPELAFRVAAPLSGKIDRAEALRAVDLVYPALEILDSRFVGFKYFSLPDVVADNCSSSRFVLGEGVAPPSDPDALAHLELRMEAEGAPVQAALASEVSGNPLQSIVELCQILAERGRALPAGSIVLAGAATQAVPLAKDMTVKLGIEHLGVMEVRVLE